MVEHHNSFLTAHIQYNTIFRNCHHVSQQQPVRDAKDISMLNHKSQKLPQKSDFRSVDFYEKASNKQLENL